MENTRRKSCDQLWGVGLRARGRQESLEANGHGAQRVREPLCDSGDLDG